MSKGRKRGGALGSARRRRVAMARKALRAALAYRAFKRRSGRCKPKGAAVKHGEAVTARPRPFAAMLAVSSGAGSMGAAAVGALAIGALAIRKLALRKGMVEQLDIRELRVGRLTVDELLVREEVRPQPPAAPPPPPPPPEVVPPGL